MRQPSILDVLRAVRDVGAAHPEVRAWWYAPPQRLRLQGAVPSAGERPPIEIAIEVDKGEVDLKGMSSKFEELLDCRPVSVRPHRGAGEERQLYRLFSRGGEVRSSS
ncbi:MAG TPA: hypothetical protein VE620_12490 [Myxococcales bacterium]|jgi:hypothetical protein|nr:hypothetical protein [Myxococcales bacterium]